MLTSGILRSPSPRGQKSMEQRDNILDRGGIVPDRSGPQKKERGPRAPFLCPFGAPRPGGEGARILVVHASAAEVETRAVRKDDAGGVRSQRAVLRLEARDLDSRAGRQRIARPAPAQQGARRAALDHPALDRAVFLRDVD